MSDKSQVNALISGPRGPDGLTDNERLLLLTLRKQGYDLVSDWCTGPHGPYQHRRVIRRRKVA